MIKCFFDKNIDRSVGGGSIHITPGIAFQEIVSEAEYQKETVAIPRSKRRSIILPSDPDSSLAIKINPQKNPAKFTTSLEPVYFEASESFVQLLALGKLSRYDASNKELHPKSSGLIIKLYGNINSPQTVMTCHQYKPQ